MRPIVIAGNWKMHKTQSEAEAFLKELKTHLEQSGKKDPLQQEKRLEVVIAAPFITLVNLPEKAQALHITVAAQNMHWEVTGAFTGEISATMLKSIDVHTTLIGHSERRQYFGETDQTVARKVTACLNQHIKPIVCIGETLTERQSGQTFNVIEKQLNAIFEVVPTVAKILIAYEPVWAIGTGLAATSAQAEEVHAFIRNLVAKRYSSAEAANLSILYGGSAKASNLEELLKQPNIDGALIGGASLDPKEFAAMMQIGNKAALG